MKNKRVLWIALIVIIAVLIALPKFFTGSKPKGGSSAGKGGPKGGSVPVMAIVIAPQLLREKIVAPGTILANDAVELKSESAGRLVALSAVEGGRVAKGALIAKINDADLQAQMLKAKAALKQAEDREARQKGLIDKGAISREEYESAFIELESAKADVALLKAQIEKTEVRAPFEGRLGLKYVSVGAYLTPGTKITTLVSDRPLKVDFNIPEKYAQRVKTGDKIAFSTSGGFAGNSGTVYAIDPMIDENSRSLHIRALCDNPNGIVPGTFADILLTLGEKPSALMVPSPALVPDATGQKIFCVKNGNAVLQPVTTGVRDSVMVEITSGLKVGDTVITTGVLLVRPGAAVLVRFENKGGAPVSISPDNGKRNEDLSTEKSR
jgi:membrane fusion protein (multidrug efflux system)